MNKIDIEQLLIDYASNTTCNTDNLKSDTLYLLSEYQKELLKLDVDNWEIQDKILMAKYIDLIANIETVKD